MAELTAPDPARVHALVVGIEHFPRIGERDLPGAAADAMRLARWLRTRGVPAGNIRLLLAPMAASWAGLNTQARELGVDIEPVTSRDQIIDKLAPAQSVPEGDVLYVYWGGHGLLDRGDRRLLLAPDASAADPRCLDLMDLREYLTRSDVVRCRKQVFLVDACATFVQDHQTRPALAALPAGKRMPAEQFMLLAAASGQAATQRNAERTGAFSTAVLDWLEEHAPGLGVDLDALVAHVKEHFADYRLGTRQLQTPVTLVIRPFGGDTEEIRPAAPSAALGEPALPPAGPGPAARRARGAGVRRAVAVGAGAAAVVVVAVLAAFALRGGLAGSPDGAAAERSASAAGSGPVSVPGTAAPSAPPSSSPSASGAGASPAPGQATAAPAAPTPAPSASGGPQVKCAATQKASDAPNVSETACVVIDGTQVSMRAVVSAAVPTDVTVYAWLSVREGNRYLYPAGGQPKTWTLTAGPQERTLTEQVTAPLRPGVAYDVHVTTKLKGGTAPAATNPAVTGHSQWFTY